MIIERLPRMDAEMVSTTTTSYAQWGDGSTTGCDPATCEHHRHGRVSITNSMGEAWDSCARCGARLPDADPQIKLHPPYTLAAENACALLPDGIVCLNGVYFRWRNGAWRVEQ